MKVVDKDLHFSTAPSLRFEHSGYRLHVEVPLLETGFDNPIDLMVSGIGNNNPGNKKIKSQDLKLHYLITHPLSVVSFFL